MNRITGGQALTREDDGLGALDGIHVDRQHVVDDPEKRIEGGLDATPEAEEGPCRGDP